MTAQEKKMKKYVNAVERRLNLPRSIRARVMSDFASDITARREAGKSDDEIYAELGTPKDAAADLNAQMAEFTYRKSPWRFLCLAAALFSGGYLLYQLLVVVLLLGVLRQSSSIGIIGSADGPTAIFVTATYSGFPWSYLFFGLVFLAGITGYFLLRKCKRP